jgi:hypothetical protein
VNSKSSIPTEGYLLLYSVGPDRRDGGGDVERWAGTYNPAQTEGDLVFPLKNDVGTGAGAKPTP